MISEMFYRHGHFCASRPWEVILVTLTLTVCLLSAGVLNTPEKVCGWNYDCNENQGVSSPSSELIIFPIVKFAAVMYTYLQFRNLRGIRTKYLLEISGIFTLSSSFVFSIAIIKMFGNDLSGAMEALPFFLLLIDLYKACALAKFALTANTQEEVQNNIAKGMSILGPAMTLDAIAEILVISVGTLSDVVQLEMMCYFGCLSVLANYLAFIMLYPACLALFFEVARKRYKGQALKQLQQVAKYLKEENTDWTINPVTQNVKMIMSAGLMLVHAHRRLMANKKADLDGQLTSQELLDRQYREPDISLWHFYLQRWFTVRADSTFTLVLAIFLIVKYLFFDNNSEVDIAPGVDKNIMPSKSSILVSKRTSFSDTNKTKIMDVIEDWKSNSSNVTSSCTQSRCSSLIEEEPIKRFQIGGDSSSDDEEDIPKIDTVGTQTDSDMCPELHTLSPMSRKPREIQKCLEIMKSEEGPNVLSDEEIISLVIAKHIPLYKIENMIGDHQRGIRIRRTILERKIDSTDAITKVPYTGYGSYDVVSGACCENVIGYIPVPLGVAGPLLLDGKRYQVPMATTEGCLVASTNRGCNALEQSSGVTSVIIADGMSRAPVIGLPSAKRASEVKLWMEETENFQRVKEKFDETSRFARLIRLQVKQAGRHLYVRFVARTGDAMGMNMLSKGSDKALQVLTDEFPDVDIISLSGNFCTDKKSSAINWLEGRGKSVICEAVIPSRVVKSVLKTTVPALVQLNISKNLVGSALAGSIGGFNAQAANVVTSVFIATGQDPAQNVASSSCITLMEAAGADNQDLYISCTMPSLEVGTVGGGTILPPQAACLKMLGIYGSCESSPGNNAKQLARVICGTVLAAELSLMSALAAGHLVRSHMRLNRSSINMAPSNSVANSVLQTPHSQSESRLNVRDNKSESSSCSKSDKSAIDNDLSPNSAAQISTLLSQTSCHNKGS